MTNVALAAAAAAAENQKRRPRPNESLLDRIGTICILL